MATISSRSFPGLVLQLVFIYSHSVRQGIRGTTKQKTNYCKEGYDSALRVAPLHFVRLEKFMGCAFRIRIVTVIFQKKPHNISLEFPQLHTILFVFFCSYTKFVWGSVIILFIYEGQFILPTFHICGTFLENNSNTFVIWEAVLPL
jgi:hypothetical protein